jgi:protocatechuate 3,4-dioxygenase beta subunit
MASSTSRAIRLALVLGTCVINVLAQTPGPPKASRPTGSISGKITYKDKGLSGIGVGLRQTNQSNPFETMQHTTTDQEGNYKISNLDPGAYEVRTTLGAYVVSDNNTGAGRPVIVMEGENIEDINFSMVKGGVITGRITDSDGRPVIQQQVRLFRAESPDNRAAGRPPQPFPANNSVTDDRGIYRIFGLRAGRYYVATGRSDTTFTPPGLPGRTSYREVFYPDATEQAKATVVEVTEGSEATNIDIVLGRPLETYSASGHIISGERGEPIPAMRYGVQRILAALERGEFVNTFLSTSSAGDFVIEGLTPGKYSVFALPDRNTEFRTDGTTFEIFDSDVSGITIKLVKGAAISGVVVIEPEDKRATDKLSQLELMAYVQKSSGAGVGMSGSSSRSSINADGSFRVSGLVGGTAMFSLNSSMQGAMKGLTIARIEREGVAQRAIEIKDGEQVTGVRVVVAYGDSVLRGIVNIENGPLPAGARIMVHLTKPGDQQPFFRPPTVDDRGRFVAESLPSGTYELAVSVLVPGLKPQPPVKQQVTLQNGVTTEVTVPFTLANSPNP